MFVREVAVERAARDPGSLEDVLNPRVLQTAIREDGHGGQRNALTGGVGTQTL